MVTLTRWITRILGLLLILLMTLIVLDVSWQVFTRFILRDPSSFTEELAGFLLIWIGLLGAAYAFHTRAHPGIDILICKLEKPKKRIAGIVINGIVIAFAGSVMVAGGIRLVTLAFTLNQISPALGIDMGYIYLVLPVSGVLILFYALDFIVRAFRKKPAGEVR